MVAEDDGLDDPVKPQSVRMDWLLGTDVSLVVAMAVE